MVSETIKKLGMIEILREILTENGINVVLESLVRSGTITETVKLPNEKEMSIYNFPGGAFLIEKSGINYLFIMGRMR